jgi:hypothetical protein
MNPVLQIIFFSSRLCFISFLASFIKFMFLDKYLLVVILEMVIQNSKYYEILFKIISTI